MPRWSSMRIRKSFAAALLQPPRDGSRLPRPPGPPCRYSSHGSWAASSSLWSAETYSRAKTVMVSPAGVPPPKWSSGSWKKCSVVRIPRKACRARTVCGSGGAASRRAAASAPSRKISHGQRRPAAPARQPRAGPARAPNASSASPVSRKVDHSSIGLAPELLVEIDGGFVPVQDTPFDAGVAAVDGGRGQMLQQRLAVAFAAGLGPDVEVFQVDPVDAFPRGVVQEPEGEAPDLACRRSRPSWRRPAGARRTGPR